MRRVALCLLALAFTGTPAGAVRIEVGHPVGLPGDEVELEVVLFAEGEAVAGVQNEIGFDGEAAIAANAVGRPDCAVAAGIGKDESSFSFQPPGCVGYSCTGIRALIISFFNVDPIPDGPLYSCRIRLDAGAPAGPHFLPCANAGAASPQADALATSCRDGEVLPPGGTPRPTPATSRTPTATRTFALEPTRILTPLADATRTPPPTSSGRSPGTQGDGGPRVETSASDGGCRVGGPMAADGSFWFGLSALWMVRRRARGPSRQRGPIPRPSKQSH